MEKKGDLILNAEGKWVKPKAQAKDGSRRGVSNLGRTQKHGKLMEKIRDEVYKATGMRDYDPLVMLATISAKAYTGYPAIDHVGTPILDEFGNQVIIPPNHELAAATAARLAPFVHRTLKPKEEEPEDPRDKDPQEAKERVLEAFRGLGVKVVDADAEPKED
jgi:hypothetical protein